MSSFSLSDIVSLCKRRGIIFQSSEIYGGMSAAWDYGPLGVEIKQNLKNFWWDFMVTRRENVVGMDGSILMHPEIWIASGHVGGFHDPMMDCKGCKKRYRQDHIYKVVLKSSNDKVVEDVNYGAASPIDARNQFFQQKGKQVLKMKYDMEVNKENPDEFLIWLQREWIFGNNQES